MHGRSIHVHSLLEKDSEPKTTKPTEMYILYALAAIPSLVKSSSYIGNWYPVDPNVAETS